MENKMKKRLSGAGLIMIVAYSALAGDAKVKWKNPEKFTDIRSSNESRENFQATVITEFNGMFSELAKKLPDGYVLDVTVTDLDLAGDVNGMYRTAGRDIRIVKELYWPRMSLSYKLTNQANEIVASGKEQLKDMGFMSRGRVSAGDSTFHYEEEMLRDWFYQMQKEKKFPSR
jgi:hypothetical protein